MTAGRRKATVAAVVALIVVAASAAAFAWTKAGAGSGAAKAGSLTTPGTPALKSGGAITATAIPVQWTAATAGAATVRYWVEHADFGLTNWTDACGTTQAAPITTTDCSDSGLTSSHDYQYRVTALTGNWKQTSGTSAKLTTATPAPTGPTLTITTAAGSGHRDVFSGTTTFRATPTASANPITVKVYAGATATGTAVRTYTATPAAGSSPFAWSVTSGNSDLTDGNQYTAQASQTDGSGNASNQPTVTFNAH